MTYEEYRAACMDVVYLSACAVNGQVPDATRVGQMDLPLLYKAADRHLLTGITAMALESAGVRDEAFTQAKGKAIRKVAAFDMERTAVLDELEAAGIWYAPVKGSVMKDLYPMIGMRQMADNDILYDASRTADVKTIMERLGFVIDQYYGRSIHDHFFKPPVCNFEMHRMLFGAGHNQRLVDYYQDIKSRLLPDEGRSFGYHFSDEDFYVYMIAHEYKHYSGGGTGLRSLLDTYVFCRWKGEALDWPYIAGELDMLGIADFEEQNRSLALHLFDSEPLTEENEAMLDYILSSGTYGTVQNRVRNKVSAYGNGRVAKLRYMQGRFFVPVRRSNRDYAAFAGAYPLFYRHKLLLPLLPFYRFGKGWPRVKVELRVLFGKR